MKVKHLVVKRWRTAWMLQDVEVGCTVLVVLGQYKMLVFHHVFLCRSKIRLPCLFLRSLQWYVASESALQITRTNGRPSSINHLINSPKLHAIAKLWLIPKIQKFFAHFLPAQLNLKHRFTWDWQWKVQSSSTSCSFFLLISTGSGSCAWSFDASV